MTKWEYCYTMRILDDVAVKELNRLGLEGWEAVCHTMADRTITVLLKREVREVASDNPVDPKVTQVPIGPDLAAYYDRLTGEVDEGEGSKPK